MTQPPIGESAEEQAARRRKALAQAGAERAKHRAEEERARRRENQRAVNRRVRTALAKASTGERSIHPALIPGIDVEDTDAKFKTNKPVFAVALIAVLGVLAWAIIAPDNLASTGGMMRDWVVVHFGWMFTIIMVAALIFLLVVGLGPTGKIKLGADDSEPEFSTFA